jgi:hypothetical protein
VSAMPVSLSMSPTSCSDGRRTNGTSGRESAGPRLNAAVWMVRRSGDVHVLVVWKLCTEGAALLFAFWGQDCIADGVVALFADQ